MSETDPITRLNAALQDRYRIERELGEGGMATVYLADDLKHERKVALKVLKPELAAVVGADRFLAEIKTTANLQHPHILPLFDSGEADGFLFYVMPYVDGETLRDRIDRERQLPLDEALGIATAVAGALQTAHDQGIVHRDIKPGNILLSRGQPLVADFGIAIAVSAGGSGRLTETGLSLGTPYYMSPEQATGDQRIGPPSDIFALACVLYELLTGEPPYPGSTAQAVLGRIIQGLPVSATAVRHSVPANVDAAIRKALEKLPADRFTGAQDFASALADPSFRHGDTADAGVATPRGSAVPLPVVAAIAVAMLGAGFGLSRVGRSDPPPAPSARFVVTGDSAHVLVSPCCGRAVAVSPDGSRLVYQGASGGTMQLYQRPLDEEVGIPIPGTEDGRHPFFSPDGEWVGFFAGDQLKKVRFDGGTPLTVTSDIRGPNAGAAWSEQGVIVYGVQGEPGLRRVSADGGMSEVITTVDTVADEVGHRWPYVLPGGETILFSVTIEQEGTLRHLIASVPIEGGAHATVGDGSDPRFVDSGHLIYGDGTGSLMAQAFDPRRLELEGTRFRIAEGVTFRGTETGMTEYDISRTGTLFFRKGPAVGAASDRTLLLVDMEGNVEDVATLGAIRHPRFSPSGRYIAYELEGVASTDNRDDIWMWDLQRSVQIRVTFEDDNSYPVWGLDDDRLYFETVSTLSTRAADGSGATEVLYRIPGNNPPYLTPDGAWLLWTSLTGEGGIFIAPADGSGEPRALIETPFTVYTPAVSPDGRWIAYTSDESGMPEIYVEPFPDRGAKFKLTSGGAWSPLWSPSGDRLYYRRGNPPAFDLVAVGVLPGEGFDVGEHRTLFETADYPVGLFRLYDISPDGSRFVFVGGADQTTADATDTNVVITNALNPGREDASR